MPLSEARHVFLTKNLTGSRHAGPGIPPGWRLWKHTVLTGCGLWVPCGFLRTFCGDLAMLSPQPRRAAPGPGRTMSMGLSPLLCSRCKSTFFHRRAKSLKGRALGGKLHSRAPAFSMGPLNRGIPHPSMPLSEALPSQALRMVFALCAP
jgi:hypothetical protein